MSGMELAHKLASLAQADIDIASAYDQALAQVKEPVINERLAKYRQDHLGHFQELAAYITDLGANPPGDRPSRTEFFPRDMTAPGEPDARGVLSMLYREEQNLRQAYSEARNWDLSLKARLLVDNGCGDENHHVRFIEEAMKDLGER